MFSMFIIFSSTERETRLENLLRCSQRHDPLFAEGWFIRSFISPSHCWSFPTNINDNLIYPPGDSDVRDLLFTTCLYV